MTPPLTDAELDHRAEVARLDGNYLALELIRELRARSLSAEDVEALRFAALCVGEQFRRVTLEQIINAGPNPDPTVPRRALAVLSRLCAAKEGA